MAQNTAHFMNTTIEDVDWSSDPDWTIIEHFTIGSKGFLFYLKRDSGRVSIRAINADGSFGDHVKSYTWTKGWTMAAFYKIANKTYLFLMKETGSGSDDNNVHIHRINSDGTVGDRVASDKWTEGWTTASFYTIANKTYLFLLKERGFGSDKNNVHIHNINVDGTVGDRVTSYKWTEGWTSVSFYTIANKTYLFLLKEAGGGSDDNNVHIHRINSDGTVGDRVTSYKWTEDWTTAKMFQAEGKTYLFLLKASGDQAGEVHIHYMKVDGTVGTRIINYGKKPDNSVYSGSENVATGSLIGWGPNRWGEGWTNAIFYETEAGHTCHLRLKQSTGRIKVIKVIPMDSVGPMVGYVSETNATIWVGVVGGVSPANSIVEYQEKNATTKPTKPLAFPNSESYYSHGVATLTGLKSNTEYDYWVKFDGRQFGPSGKFRTAPSASNGNDYKKFTMAFSSCMDVGANRDQLSWIRLEGKKPAFHLLLGDTAYPNTANRGMQWGEHLQQRGVTSFASVIAKIPTLAMWDDHDFGPNNSSGSDMLTNDDFTGFTRDDSLSTFKELFPNPLYPSNQGLFYKFRWGVVEFFILDGRYFRTHYTKSSSTGSTLLGTVQWDWLKQGLEDPNSTAVFKVIASGITLEDGTENWKMFRSKYNDLVNLLKDQDGSALLLSGDIHECKVKPYSDKKFTEVVSSGIGRAGQQGFVTLTFDATIAGQENTKVCLHKKTAGENWIREYTIPISTGLSQPIGEWRKE